MAGLGDDHQICRVPTRGLRKSLKLEVPDGSGAGGRTGTAPTRGQWHHAHAGVTAPLETRSSGRAELSVDDKDHLNNAK